MSEIAEHSFRTKTGTCTITPDQIVLTRDGVRGAAASWTVGSSIRRSALLYGLIGAASFILGVSAFSDGDLFTGVFACALGALFVWNVVASRHNSAAPVIDRRDVRTVEAHAPRPPATRGYFAVLFQENGRERKRLIMLPGSMNNGQEEYARAKAAMRDSGLLPGP